MSLPLSLDRLLVSLDADVDSLAVAVLPADARCTAPAADAVMMHQVLQGSVFVVAGKKPGILVGAGGLIIMPSNSGYALQTAAVPRWNIEVSHALGGRWKCGTGGCRLSWSAWRANAPIATGVLSGLRAPLIVQCQSDPLSAAVLEALDDALSNDREGSRTIAASLKKTMLVRALRGDLDRTDGSFVLPATVLDRRLNRAAAAVVDSPAQAHSVASLACVAGMSRSAFAAEFKSATGMTPMQFVTETRLAAARRLLITTNLRIGVVASLAGFIDRSYFSRSFRAHYGIDPTSFRRSEIESGAGQYEHDFAGSKPVGIVGPSRLIEL